jgi:DNA-binding MarR family transcriptional regulator
MYVKSDKLIEVRPEKKEDLIASILGFDRLVQRLIRAGWPEAWQHINLPLGATRALLLIEAGRASTPREVAGALGVSRTTVTGLIDRLEIDGLITRSIDPEDKRSFALNLTEKGKLMVRQIEEIRRNQLAEALVKMDDRALKALDYGFAALVEAMQGSQLQVSSKNNN